MDKLDLKDEVGTVIPVLIPPVAFLLTVPRQYFFVDLFSYLCLSLPSVMSVYCSLAVTC